MTEDRLARIETNQARFEERLNGGLQRIENQLETLAEHNAEYRGVMKERVDRLEASQSGMGARIGTVEAEIHRAKGGKAALLGLLTGGGALGAGIMYLFGRAFHGQP
ncbi:MAG: hypothetical protein FWG17_03065 [Desulfovibrionaceae bacterium]|nr:hypothetical protein [Desulfovibrionaceae bacterium]